MSSWKSLSHAEIPPEPASRFQKVWDTVASTSVYNDILTRCPGDADQARLKAANSSHAGEWLNAPPIASVGLRLSDEEIRVAVGYRLGSSICQPHQCHVRLFRWCKRPFSRLVLQKECTTASETFLNLWHSLEGHQEGKVLGCKEPVWLSRSDDKRPDGATLIPWSHGKPLAWDITVPDTFAQSHITSTATNAGADADKAACV